jgi:glycosyltransferase involved in cell wall biosynthesis
VSGARRLLVISYHFWGDGAVGGLRWAGLTKYLARLGWQVAVLTAAPPLPGEEIAGVRAERCTRLWTVNDCYRLLVRADQREGRRPLLPSRPTTSSRSGLWRELRRELVAFLALPDDSRGWGLRAALHARSLLRRFQPQVVVSSGPPHAAHLVAGLALLGSQVRWFVDLRDPWAGPHPPWWKSHPLCETRIARAVIPRLERLVFRAAEGVIVTTPHLAHTLATKYPGIAVSCIPNGVDLERLPPPARDPVPGLAIASVGTLYGHRDLGPVLQALRVFLQRHPEAAQDRVKLRIAGHAEAPHARALEEQVASLGLGEHVEVLGQLPRTQALDLMSRSHLSVVLAQNQEWSIPAKLYEPVALGIPTLVVAEQGSAAALEGQRLGASVLGPHDAEGIAHLLERLWRREMRTPFQCLMPVAHEAIAPLVDRLLTRPSYPGATPSHRQATPPSFRPVSVDPLRNSERM